MLIGHFAVGFAAKRAAPRTSLTTLVLAALSLDMVSPLFVWLGIERVRVGAADGVRAVLDPESYRWSHSLLVVLVWTALLAWLYRFFTGYARGAFWVGVAVFSHWVLDFVSRRSDLPIAPGIPVKLGLELWSSVAASVMVEVGMFAAGVLLYVSATRAKNWLGHVSLWTLVVALVCGHWVDIAGSPPPSVGSIKVMGLVGCVLVLWFVWIDHARELRPGWSRAAGAEPVPPGRGT